MKMRTWPSRALHVTTYDSLNEFAADISAAPFTCQHRDSIENRFGFTWTRSYNEAESLVKTGWDKGRAAIGKLSAQALPMLAKENVESWTLDVAGGFPCVPAFLSGDPENMWKLEEDQAEQSNPTLHLVINSCASAVVTADQFQNVGASIVALVDSLETQGIQCAIDVACAVKCGRFHDILLIKAKEYAAPLDLDKIAFTIAHPSFVRRLAFRHLETSPAFAEIGAKFPEFYGQPTQSADFAYFIKKIEPDAVAIPGCADIREKSSGATLKGALEMVRTQVQKALPRDFQGAI